MDPATDQYYRWLTVIAGPVFYNLMMIVTRYDKLNVLQLIVHLEKHKKNEEVFLCSRACFNELQESYTNLWIFLDYTSDLIYYTDTFVRSRTGQILKNVSRKEFVRTPICVHCTSMFCLLMLHLSLRLPGTRPAGKRSQETEK